MLVDQLFTDFPELREYLLKVLFRIVKAVGEGVVHASFRIHNPHTGMLEKAVEWNICGQLENQGTMEISCQNTLAGEAVRERRVLTFPDVIGHRKFHDQERAKELGVRSLMVIPMFEITEGNGSFREDGPPVAVVQLYALERDKFQPEHGRVAEAISGLAAFSIRQAIGTLPINEVTDKLLTKPGLEPVLQKIAELASRIMGKRRVSIYVIGDKPHTYRLAAGIPIEGHTRATLTTDELPILDEVVKHPSYVVRNVLAEPRCAATHSLARIVGIIGTLFVPLRVGKRVVGVINIDRVVRERDGIAESDFSEDDESWAKTVAKKASLAVWIAYLVKRTQQAERGTYKSATILGVQHILGQLIPSMGLALHSLKKDVSRLAGRFSEEGVDLSSFSKKISSVLADVESLERFVLRLGRVMVSEGALQLCDVPRLVKDAVVSVSVEAQEKGVEITPGGTFGTPIFSDPILLSRMFLIFLQSFLKQAQEGDQILFWERLESQDDVVAVKGPGLTEELVEQALESLQAIPMSSQGNYSFLDAPMITLFIKSVSNSTVFSVRIHNAHPGEEVFEPTV